VPALFCRSNEFEVDDEDLYTILTLHDSWKKMKIEAEDNRGRLKDKGLIWNSGGDI
jgi:hypothetical protein